MYAPLFLCQYQGSCIAGLSLSLSLSLCVCVWHTLFCVICMHGYPETCIHACTPIRNLSITFLHPLMQSLMMRSAGADKRTPDQSDSDTQCPESCRLRCLLHPSPQGACTHTHTHTRIRAHARARTRAHAHAHREAQNHTHVRVYPCALACRYFRLVLRCAAHLQRCWR